MIKSLSKSTWIIFIFDLIILCSSTIFWWNCLSLSTSFLILFVCFISITGVLILFLKDNYKIREFNITFWNFYRLFEVYF